MLQTTPIDRPLNSSFMRPDAEPSYLKNTLMKEVNMTCMGLLEPTVKLGMT
jgi:hypothetical protein